ncbi:MAG: hypothetical protein IJT74_06145 [Bacteroidales bacterium]|nr:hypothetical protein [Bacteroidales bacterium]
MLPPSPEAAAAVKYADVPFTHSLGMAELEVPLYTLQGRELTLPVALRYRSGGIKLDEVAGVAGLGWTLEAGGCVTRTVVDMPDEFSAVGFSHQLPSGTLLTNLQNQTNTTDAMDYLRDVAWHRTDSALDRFSYSICGLDGSFVIKDDGSVFQLSGDGVLISYTRDNDGAIDTFTLTGPDGTVYVLDEKETGIHRGRYTPPTPSGSQQDDWEATTAWYLKSVTSPGGLECATYAYSDGGTWTCDICPRVWSANFVCDGSNTTSSTDIDSDVIQHRYQTKVLSSITLSGFTAVFSYSSSTGSVGHSTTSSWDRYANYPCRLSRVDVSYEGTLLQRVDVGTQQDVDDGRIVLGSLRYYRGGVLDDKWDFTYSHAVGPFSSGGSVSRYSQDWYGYYNAENEKTASPSRTNICPYKMEEVGGSPTVSLAYGEPDGDYAHYMSLVNANHDGAVTQWEWEGASITVGSTDYTVGSRVKSITVKDNGVMTVRKRCFTYASAATRGRLYPTADMYMNLHAAQRLSGGNYFQNLSYSWTFTLHETPVVEGPSIQDTRILYGSVTEEETDGTTLHGAKTVYTYDTSRIPLLETETIGRFPTGWASTYNSAYAPVIISPWWGVREYYTESGPEPPALLTRKDIYSWDGTQHTLLERESYTYPGLSRRQVLVDYRATQVMERYPSGNPQYEDIYHYPIWARDYAGVQPTNITYIGYHTGGNDTTTVSCLFVGRNANLTDPIRVSRRVVQTTGQRRGVQYTYPDTWGLSAPTWATQLSSRHSLSEPVKEVYGRMVTANPHHGLRFVEPVIPLLETVEPWLEVVKEYGLFTIGNQSRLLMSSRTESVDGRLAWSEEILGRDSLGNPSLIKEKGKPLTAVQWGYNGLFPVSITENASSSQTHVSTFTYAPGKGLLSMTDPSGVMTSYERDGAGRLTAQKDAGGHILQSYVYALMNDGGQRSMKSRSHRSEDGNSYSEDVRWWNSLGLLQEEIALHASGEGKDLVTAYEGDYLLHEDVKSWLPYPVQNSGGTFQSNSPAAAASYHGNSAAYMLKRYEESPRDLVIRTALPGYAGTHEGEKDININTSWPLLSWNDSLGVVSSGVATVREEREADADGRSISAFKDGEGRLLGTARDTAITYYVYDAHDRLRAVVGSGIALTDTLNMWRYGYDSLSRVASKAVPGAAREYYTYDNEDRLIQISRTDGCKDMTHDAFGRLLTLSYTPAGGTAVQLEEHGYDNESATATTMFTATGEPASWSGATTGLETWRSLAMLGENGTVTGYSQTALRYDDKARPVCSVTQWTDDTVLKEKTTYNFPGEVIRSVSTFTHGTNTDSLTVANAYDIRGRVIQTVSSLSHNGTAVASDTTAFSYDALGRPFKTISKAGGASSSMIQECIYNLQGFRNKLAARHGTDSLYVERLAYDNPSAVTGLSGTSPSYSGYITGRKESWPGASYARTESYGYDAAGRLSSVIRSGGTQQYTYDNRGNLLTAPSQTYTYSGDRLQSLTESGSGTCYFQHDNLGRITTDGKAGVTLSYNCLDLPRKISASSGGVLVNYSYLADGSKAEALRPDGTGLVYRGSLIYRRAADGTLALESAATPCGRLTPQGVRYHVTDHLGSVMAVVDAGTGSLFQASEYAPYGSRTVPAAVTVSTAPAGETFRDQFTGKEAQDPDFGVSYLDFGARHYSPSLRRWLVPDPMGEEYYDVSPYVYCAGNPVMLVDEDGRDVLPKGLNELEIIKNTLPEDARSYVQVDETGIINAKLLKQYSGNSSNYAALMELVDSRFTIIVSSSSNYSYRKPDGKVYNDKSLSYTGVDEFFFDTEFKSPSGLTTGETGNYGKTLFPDLDGLENSTSTSIEIYLHPSLSDVGAAEAFSHEAYGHALLYLTNGFNHEGASHSYVGLRDTNLTLVKMILQARRETVYNMGKL